MTELDDLYREVILDHNKRPRNFHRLQGANLHAEGHNPLCGDRISLDVKVDGGVIRDIGFAGSGCAISKASASMMTDAVKGKTLAEAEEFFRQFHAMVAGTPDEGFDPSALGKLAAFSGVREFPVRVKCASLAWHTLRTALQRNGETVTTEEGSE
jgi:nitrogen fixation NifU-like protein